MKNFKIYTCNYGMSHIVFVKDKKTNYKKVRKTKNQLTIKLGPQNRKIKTFRW